MKIRGLKTLGRVFIDANKKPLTFLAPPPKNPPSLRFPFLFLLVNTLMKNYAVPNIAALRKRTGLSQTQLANIVGVDPVTIRNWERGRSGLDWFVKLAKLCEALDCSPRDLVKDPDSESKKVPQTVNELFASF